MLRIGMMTHIPCNAVIVITALMLSACGEGDTRSLPNRGAAEPIELSNIEQLISNEALDQLVRDQVSVEELTAIYGAPLVSTEGDGVRYVGYNFTTSHPSVAARSGRVGFTAKFREGKMFEWMDLTME